MKRKIPRAPRLFINYRTDETGAVVTSLVEYLERELAPDQIFIDREGIDAGDEWPRRLRDELERCTVFLAFLGRGWLASFHVETGQPRIEDPSDWVRREIERALQRARDGELLFVPILVDGAELPKAEALPDGLKELANRQARWLRPLAKRDLTGDREIIRDLLLKNGFVARSDPDAANGLSTTWYFGCIVATLLVIAWAAYESGHLGNGTAVSTPQPTPFAWSELGHDGYGKWGDVEIDGARLRLRWMEPGTFSFGSPNSELGRDPDETQRSVDIANGFWIADSETTQELWQAVMGGGDDRFRFKGAQRPAENVSWEDVEVFLNEVNRRLPGIDLRLPSESEWEYACRAGTTTPFSLGKTVTTDQVNFDGTYPYGGEPKGKRRNESVEARSLPANRWGLHEMHGNVWEWCADRDAESSRVLRGGSWINNAASCRSASRATRATNRRSGDVGFRVARSDEMPNVDGR